MWSALRLQSWLETKTDLKEILSAIRKGKTFEELFGEKTAKIAKEKIKLHWAKYWSDPKNVEKHSIIMKKTNYIRGKHISEDVKKKISDSRILWWKNLSEQEKHDFAIKASLWHKFKTKERKKEIGEKIGASLKIFWENLTQEERNNFFNNRKSLKGIKSTRSKESWEKSIIKFKETVRNSNLFSGENNSMYGKHHSEESKRKISESNRGKSKIFKPRAIFKFYRDDIFIYEAIGQIDAKLFCKKENISFQTLCKITNRWKNWFCERKNKI
jgi:hypothetical protein